MNTAMVSNDQRMSNYVKEYCEKGFTTIPNLLNVVEVERLRRECERLWQIPGLDDDLNLRTEFRRDQQDGYVLDRLDPVLDLSPLLTEAALHPRLISIVSALLDGHSRLMKCKLIRKDPGTKGYAVHQDFLYWRWLDIAPERLCSVALNLYDTDDRSGGIGFYPAQHQTLIPGPNDDSESDCDITRINTSVSEVPKLKAGDALVFHSLAPHFSGPNVSERPRTILLPSYCSSPNHDVYSRYYLHEVKRRCGELVGFERYMNHLSLFENSLSATDLSRSIERPAEIRSAYRSKPLK
jgi:hypothetical protein